jgi:hypothetical protein
MRSVGLLDRVRGAFHVEEPPHYVEVMDVRPSPDEKEDFEPYFVAICDCGWVGLPVSGPGEAFEEARLHSPLVSDEVRRPVG